MKKKRLLFSCLGATFALVLTACDFLPSDFFPNKKDSSSEQSSSRVRSSRTPSSSEHVHTFREDWSYNASSHWHDSDCGHTVTSEYAPHEFVSAVIKEATCTAFGEEIQVCKICDFQRSYVIPKTDHNWSEYSRVEPTCYEPGLSRQYCSTCGESRTVELPALDHDYISVAYQAATCQRAGYNRMQCSRCGNFIDYDIPMTKHSWGPVSYVSGTEGNLGYTVSSCRNCSGKRIAIAAIQGEVNGSIKSSAAADIGYVKLSANENSISYRFNYPSNAYGKLYQHACFDSTGYYGYSYRSGAYDYPYNFEANLNGAVIDLTQSADIPYEQFFDGEGSEEILELYNAGFSRANDCIVGDISLMAGTNTFTYTRKASYGVCVDYFIFEVYDSNHSHVADSVWSTDGSYHWHACVGTDCPVPDVRLDVGSHSFGIRETITAVTCHNDGLERETCSVCGYQNDIIIPQTDHIYQQVGSIAVADGSANLEEYSCTTCDNSVLRWSASQYDQSLSQLVDTASLPQYVRFQSGSAVNRNGVEQDGGHIVYRINVPTALSNVGLAFNVAQSSSPVFNVYSQGASDNGYVYDASGQLVMATKKYGLKVNGVEVQLGDDNYGRTSGTSSPNWYNWPVSFDLVAGINIIDIYCLSGSYRGRMYDFQITNIPFIEPNHTHVASENYSYDGTYHYRECVSGDGVRFNEEYHTYGDYRITVAPTCTGYGVEEATCTVCGYVGSWTIEPHGHYWDEGTVSTAATHRENGVMTYTCSECGEQMTKPIKADHNWGSPTAVAASDDYVGYTKYNCLDDNATKIDIKALDGTFAEGSTNYSGLPEGYLRLNAVGNSISYKFNYDSHAFGKLYLRSSCGSFSSYKNRTFAYNASGTSNGCNFEFVVNGLSVDMTAVKDITFEEMFANGWIDPNLSSNYSPVEDCLIGNVELFAGENNIVYTRLGSFNLNSTDLILVVEPSDHVHSYSNNYDFNDNYHWRTCSDPNCPLGSLLNTKEYHNMVYVGEQAGSSCYDDTSAVYQCSVCGYQTTTAQMSDHLYLEGGTTSGVNSDGVTYTTSYCVRCNKTIEAINFGDGLVIEGSYNSGKLTAPTTMAWKFPVNKTGLISIYLPVRISSGAESRPFDPTLYQVVVNNEACETLLQAGTYTEVGFNTSYSKYFKFSTYQVTSQDVANGEIEIKFTSNNSSYRLIFDQQIRIEY